MIYCTNICHYDTITIDKKRQANRRGGKEMKITQRMKNELKAFRYVDTRNYRYELDVHYDGSARLIRIPMNSVRRQTVDLIDGWETIMDVDLTQDKWRMK